MPAVAAIEGNPKLSDGAEPFLHHEHRPVPKARVGCAVGRRIAEAQPQLQTECDPETAFDTRYAPLSVRADIADALKVELLWTPPVRVQRLLSAGH